MQPVSADVVAQARVGDWAVILTPTKVVPWSWFGVAPGAGLNGIRVLCLASGGGQQVPVLAAAGARVTSFDYSAVQLEKDAEVAAREHLDVRIEQGDMADLSRFADRSFDLIFHPVSNVFAADPIPVWQECARLLVPGGRLLAGFMNPDYFLFDHQDIEDGGPMTVRYPLPYADIDHLPKPRLEALVADNQALEFSHSLDSQIGAQLRAGLLLEGFYEDRWSDEATALNRYMPTSMATLARKPAV